MERQNPNKASRLSERAYAMSSMIGGIALSYHVLAMQVQYARAVNVFKYMREQMAATSSADKKDIRTFNASIGSLLDYNSDQVESRHNMTGSMFYRSLDMTDENGRLVTVKHQVGRIARIPLEMHSVITWEDEKDQAGTMVSSHKLAGVTTSRTSEVDPTATIPIQLIGHGPATVADLQRASYYIAGAQPVDAV